MAKFNLLEEPWIPVLKEDKVVEVGLGEALTRAHTIMRIETPSPLEEAALHRLLLAVLYRALPPVRNKDDALDLLEKGEFDQRSLEGYLNRYHDCFFLFHDTAPFLQIADLPENDPLPWTKLLPELASGHNPTLFDHTVDDNPPLASYAEAARALLVHQAFAPGGLLRRLGVTSADGAPLARHAVFLAMGGTLFQTLVLNLVPQEDTSVPIWEHRPPLKTEDVHGYATQWPLSGVSRVYTWPSRGVRLLDEGQGVRWMTYGPGVKPQEVAWRDPMVAYRQDKKSHGILPLRLSTERSFWRDFEAMLPAAGGVWPAVLVHAGELKGEGVASTLRVLGQVSDQAKILDIRREVYPISKELLTPEGELVLKRSLELAEKAATGLKEAAWRIAQGALGNRDTSELRNFTNSLPLLSLYWSRLDLDFPDFMGHLGQSGALDLWRQRIRRAALRAWEETRRFIGTEARYLKALAEGERAFARVLATIQGKEVKG